MEKRHIITRIDRIYRILMDKLRYNIDNWDEFEIIDFYPDLCMIGEWAEDIREEWKSTHPDYIPFELEKFGITGRTVKPSVMPTAISVAHQLLSNNNCPDEVKDSLSKFLNVMASLNNDIDKYQKDLHGKLYGVPKELQTQEALDLLDLCVKADLLDDHYQPAPGTKRFQLLLIAQGIGSTLKLDPLYTVFEHLWNIRYLRHQSVPKQSKTELKNKVMDLFPNATYRI